MFWRELVFEALKGDKEYVKKLKEGLKQFNLKAKELAKLSEVPLSTLYKILSLEHVPRMDTFRKIVKAFQKLEKHEEKPYIAIIAAKYILEQIKVKEITVKKSTFKLREYPASELNEVLVQAVKAEKDGCLAIVCAPIASTNIEKVVDIPVISMKPSSEVLIDAVYEAAQKIIGK